MGERGQEAVNAKAVKLGVQRLRLGRRIPVWRRQHFGLPGGRELELHHAVPALGLLYLMREKDRMAVTKMVQQFGASTKGGQRRRPQPHGRLHARSLCRKVMDEDPKYVPFLLHTAQ